MVAHRGPRRSRQARCYNRAVASHSESVVVRSATAAGVWPRLRRAWPLLLLAAWVMVLCVPGLLRRDLDGVDAAVHVMSSIFFRDLFVHPPTGSPVSYVYDYYRQYPALGFVFWPPFYFFVQGLFFLFGGVDLAMARLCTLAFSMALGLFAYWAVRPQFGRAGSLVAALLIVGSPVIVRYMNGVGLEVPVLAMGLATVALYRRAMAGPQPLPWRTAVLLAVLAAAAIYTKQTIAFVAPVLLIDLCVNHRERLRDRRLWVSAALFVALCLPLAAFTLTFGRFNIEQSLGNAAGTYEQGRASVSRLSPEAWLFYPRLAPELLNPVVLALAVLGIVLVLFRPRLRRDNVLWLAWILVWYVMFSYFDNRQLRYAALCLPGLVVLAVAAGRELLPPGWNRRTLAAVPVVAAMGLGLLELQRVQTGQMDAVEPIVQSLLAQPTGGNIAYFGHFRQVFVPFVRLHDPARRTYVLQGDDVVGAAGGVAEACRNYKIRWLLVEEGEPVLGELAQAQTIEPWKQERFGPDKSVRTLHILRYTGEHAERMKKVPLESSVVKVKAK